MKLTVPNQLTLFRILLTPIFIYLFLKAGEGSHLAAGLVFLFASFTDWYDGYIARRFNLISRWGQFMDPLADKILVSSALVVFAYQHYVMWWMVWIIIGRDFLVTFLRSFALSIGKPIVTSTLAKWKTFIQMAFVFAILIYINIPDLADIRLSTVESPWLQWTTYVIAVVVLLTIYSGIHYLIVNFSHLIELGRRIFNLFNRKRNDD